RLDDARIHVGAALDPAECHAAGGPLPVMRDLLESAGHRFPAAHNAAIAGTGRLTCRREQLGGHRVLAVGDACGYVEPFTGEGISWAIRGAISATHLLPGDPCHWLAALPSAWRELYDRGIGARQWWCRRFRSILQRPLL